jgi:lathosterol oxidase
MLCEISLAGNFFTTWLILVCGTFASVMVMSGATFYALYWQPSYDTWVHKSNPRYPSAKVVKNEIFTMIKGLATAALCPSLALYLANTGHSKAYCGVTEEHPWSYLVGSFLVCWLVSDFFEFYYHRLGHTVRYFWGQHKAHHVFFNPSPFAVIAADEYIDQLFRASPLLVFPLIAPVNIDMLFVLFAGLFYCYGTYIHSGFELSWLDAHHPILNTSFQHYIHHAKSVLYKPYHTGFVFKIWDQLFGSVYDQECVCAKCEHGRGNRSRMLWAKVDKPDYSVMLRPMFWITP